ncbi:uncharacterized protein LOC127832521 [Dreissena polymorpha]|uniref:Uncharacterized protein n=1 Tax=Dreissena polymorpha TaxID=45954 RepID=A0A9D4GPA3_DREPO|nr:uncharacterized protein LOC127832521 [Dreissena polymorpha]KAH3821101.1 hypothetical protein DPMN_122859 [Dreissena polymorpha]
MWQYLLAHAAYHGVRWFPQGNRWKMALLMQFLSGGAVLGQIFVLWYFERVSRYCEQPLLPLEVASVILSIFTLGFTVVFCVLIPVTRAIKIVFHIFGVGCFVIGVWQIYSVVMSYETCSVTTPELYFLSQISAIMSGVAILVVVVMLPFWLLNACKRGIVLDPYSRTGICYEPAKCCTCLWHI